MLLETSQTTKKLVGKLDSGKELMSALTDVCRAHAIGAGSIQIFGSLSSIELMAQDGKNSVQIFKGEGCFRVLSFMGTISMYNSGIVLDATCTVSALGPLGPQLIGGIIKTATIENIDILLSAMDDLVIEREPNLDAGRFTIQGFRKKSPTTLAKPERPQSKEKPSLQHAKAIEIEPLPKESQLEQAELSWEDAAATKVSKPKKRLVPRHERISNSNASLANFDEESDIDEELSAGDLLLHPKLGECRVIKVEANDFARVRLPKGQLRKLSLAICVPIFVEHKNGRNIFKIRIN